MGGNGARAVKRGVPDLSSCSSTHPLPVTPPFYLVGKGQDPLGVGLGHREEVLEDVAHAHTQLGGEVVKDEVGVGLRNRSDRLLIANVVPQNLRGRRKGM